MPEAVGDALLRPATPADVPLLVEMNLELIADEGGRNPMGRPALERRMTDYLAAGWTAPFIVDEGVAIGYLLYRLAPDAYYPEQRCAEIRHFYVRPDRRRRGLGRRAGEELVRVHLPPATPVAIDVLHTNPAGLRFWRSLGFRPYCTTMWRPAPPRRAR